MNKQDMLRQLGWSEDLIAEVTRVSGLIQEVAKNIHPVDMPTKARSVAGSAISYDAEKLSTSYQLFMPKQSAAERHMALKRTR